MGGATLIEGPGRTTAPAGPATGGEVAGGLVTAMPGFTGATVAGGNGLPVTGPGWGLSG